MTRKLLLLLLIPLLLLLTVQFARIKGGQQLQRALKLEQQRPAAALALYQTILNAVPARNHVLRSRLYFRMGECYWGMERVTEAYTAFQKAADLDNRNIGAHLRLGEMLLAGGMPDKASDQANAVLRVASTNPEALALLGSAAAAIGDNGVARLIFNRTLEIDPSRVTVALALADLEDRDDHTDRAREILHRAAAAQPASSLPWLALGRLEEQEGNEAAAEQDYRHAVVLEDTPETNLRLAQFLERTARVPEAEKVLRRVDQFNLNHSALPDFELFAGHPADARRDYLQALSSESRPFDKNLPGRPHFAGLNDPLSQSRAGLCARLVEADLQTASDPRLSRAESSALIARAAADLDAYRLYVDPATIAVLEAEIAISRSDYQLAALHATTAVTLAPHSAAVLYVSGEVKSRQGDAVGARTDWLAALDADPTFIPVRLALANQSLHDGDLRAAEGYVIPAVRDEPGNLGALISFARVLLAGNKFESARVIAQRAMTIDKSKAEPHLLLGEIALQQKRLGEALIQFEQAVILEPHSQAAIDGLARVYQHGAVNEALLRKMETVAQNPPESATLLEISGKLYAELGMFDDAKRCLSRAVQLDPERTTAAVALAKAQAATHDVASAADSLERSSGTSAALMAGIRADQESDVSTAGQQYEAAIRHGEHSGVAANNLAWLYAEQGIHLDRALALARTAHDQQPDNPAILDTLGMVHLRRREYSDAIDWLQRARELAVRQNKTASPQPRESQQLMADIQRHLAEAYLRAGQTDEAARLEARAQKLAMR